MAHSYDATMNQERDIDEILASLDALLQENDGMSAEKVSKKSSDVEASRESSRRNDHTKVAHIESDEPTADAPLVAKAPHTVEKTVLQPPRRLDPDVPDANFRMEPRVDELEPVIPRVVLTKEMMVKKPESPEDALFSPLLEAMGDEDSEDTCEEEASDSQELSIHLSVEQVEQMLELVSMDVSYQFHQLLPEMIRTSLQTHLNMMQEEQNKKQQAKENR